MIPTELADGVVSAVNTDRLVETAMSLVEVPSPTCNARAAADRLAEILQAGGFAVERPEADWPEAPAVVARLDSGRRGRTLQFNGHLDTVHLPFVAPRKENGNLYGSGISDMKGGVAAAVEALRALKQTGVLEGGGVLLTAHELHEGPWGDKRQVRALIRDGFIGDAVLLPEYCASPLPMAGRGMAIFQARIHRDGEAVHEVLRPLEQPLVIPAGAELIVRLKELPEQASANTDPDVGQDSVFVGQIQSGEIYNQSPTECFVRGTRRWVTPGGDGGGGGAIPGTRARPCPTHGHKHRTRLRRAGRRVSHRSRRPVSRSAANGPCNRDREPAAARPEAVRRRRQLVLLARRYPRPHARP